MATGSNNLDFDCDWRYGINVHPSRKARVGYLLTWSGVGGLNLTQDITVWNPFSTQGQRVVSGPKVTCIGLMESFRFMGDETDPIRIRALVSKKTATDLRSKLSRPLTNTKVKVAWYIIDFDEDDKLWFEAALVKSPTEAEANLDTAGGTLQMFVDNQPTRVNDSLDIRLYGFEFQVVPADGVVTNLEFASGSSRRLVKPWGEESSE